MSYLLYLYLFAHSDLQHILYCVFLCLVCPMLPVSLDCPFLIAPSVFSKVYLTIKTSASPEACIVEHPYSNNFLLSMFIKFCLFSEYARNSSTFDLNGVYSVNNTLSPPAVPARLRCVLVDYLSTVTLCVVKSLFLCVFIFFSCAIFHINFSITKLYSSLLFFKIYSKNHYLLFCRKAFLS